MRVPSQILKSVVYLGRLKNDEDDGEFMPRGTGFLVIKVDEGRVFHHLVTALHCLERACDKKNRVFFRLNTKDGKSEVVYSDFHDWKKHPDSSFYIDVAVLPIHMPKGKYDYTCANIDRDAATQTVLMEEAIGPGDEIFTTGLFTLRAGEERNRPIIRTGNIAAMPDEPVWTSVGYMDAYLVEARSIGGLSGSPVFVHMAPLRIIEGNVTPSHHRIFYLLGLMHGHFDERAKNELNRNPADDEKLHTGIGIVVPVEKIIETIDQDDFRAERKKILDELKATSGAVPDFAAEASEAPAGDENPHHKEDFNRLLDAVAKGKPPSEEA